MNLRGIIENVRYKPTLLSPLKSYAMADFDINSASGCGLLSTADSTIGYSKWISPKRTRSYPFARIYNTMHLGKRATIIPVIKDEGIEGDNDRINFITLSMMNLLNVFVILAWYDDAQPHRRRAGKITAQRLNSAYVQERLAEIVDYQQTALHWNIMHFERDFEQIYQRAVERYDSISQRTGIQLHTAKDHLAVLGQFMSGQSFNRDAFREMTLARSQSAALREQATMHLGERLGEGAKAYLALTNFLGGEYHLTVDEVYDEDGGLILQESKHSTQHHLPSMNDIRDALLKLMLYANVGKLYRDDRSVRFGTRLKLTGRLQGYLSLPIEIAEIDGYAKRNQLSPVERQRIHMLNEEVTTNVEAYHLPLSVRIGDATL